MFPFAARFPSRLKAPIPCPVAPSPYTVAGVTPLTLSVTDTPDSGTLLVGESETL